MNGVLLSHGTDFKLYNIYVSKVPKGKCRSEKYIYEINSIIIPNLIKIINSQIQVLNELKLYKYKKFCTDVHNQIT